MDASLQSVQSLRRQLTAALDRFRTASLDELTSQFRDQLGGRRFTEELRKRQVDAITADLGTLDVVAKQNSEARKSLDEERQSLGAKERVVEERRMTDLKAKTDKLLADCDLLIIPRMTVRDIVSGYRIPPRYYKLDDVQVAAVKDFLKAGKPVLACFGPTNEPADRRAPLPPGPDNLEELFAQLGIRFGKQTVLFGADSKAFAERRSNVFATGAAVEWPPVRFEPPDVRSSAGYNPATALAGDEPKLLPLNSVALSMKLMGRSVGGGQKLNLRLNYPRPVYYVPVRPTPQAAEPGFVFGDPDSWNEDQPFPTRERTPRFEPPKPDDPAKGTRDERRRGSFPLAVAVETTVPAEWQDPRAAAATHSTTVRVAAVGHGGLFVGTDLGPAKERLLLNTCNWLLGRDERLPHESAAAWRYPRVQLTDRARTLWVGGTLLALPALFVYLGRLVLLVRHYR